MKIYVVVSKQLGELKAHAAFESRDLADAYRGRVWCDHIFDVCQSDFKVLECELFEVDEGPVDLKLMGTYE